MANAPLWSSTEVASTSGIINPNPRCRPAQKGVTDIGPGPGCLCEWSLAHDVFHVCFHCWHGDTELTGNFFVGRIFGQGMHDCCRRTRPTTHRVPLSFSRPSFSSQTGHVSPHEPRLTARNEGFIRTTKQLTVWSQLLTFTFLNPRPGTRPGYRFTLGSISTQFPGWEKTILSAMLCE